MKNLSTTSPNKGIGSFFSFVESNSKKFYNNKTNFNPKNKILFYTGRHAIKFIIETIKLEGNINTFWIPDYYCQHVTSWLKMNYSNIKTYTVNPLENSEVIRAYNFLNDSDVIMVNNFWGLSNCTIDIKNKKVKVIEDHSHGWLSDSCKMSKADYCFASLRKTLPVPLGGIAWKPNGEKLKTNKYINSNMYINLWDKILLGMKKKSEFEYSIKKNESLKNQFLKLVYEAENSLHADYNLVKIDKKHKEVIKSFLKIDYLSFKNKNLNLILKLLQNNNGFNVIKSKSTPFGMTLHFENLKNMNNFKNYLISNKIYPSLLWPDNNTQYGYFLNIHIDYRYTEEDMNFIATTINGFGKN
ncbi:hypothetical protein [Yeosuana marina]|uniref:hypothetical protein n=1 Tax=Yeosuana marina TaxID=1565536 RepID=UPI0030C8CDC0